MGASVQSWVLEGGGLFGAYGFLSLFCLSEEQGPRMDGFLLLGCVFTDALQRHSSCLLRLQVELAILAVIEDDLVVLVVQDQFGFALLVVSHRKRHSD
jgi:hypothetical protein